MRERTSERSEGRQKLAQRESRLHRQFMSRVFSYLLKNSSALRRLTPRFRLCLSGFWPQLRAKRNSLCFVFHSTTILVVVFPMSNLRNLANSNAVLPSAPILVLQ